MILRSAEGVVGARVAESLAVIGGWLRSKKTNAFTMPLRVRAVGRISRIRSYVKPASRSRSAHPESRAGGGTPDEPSSDDLGLRQAPGQPTASMDSGQRIGGEDDQRQPDKSEAHQA